MATRELHSWREPQNALSCCSWMCRCPAVGTALRSPGRWPAAGLKIGIVVASGTMRPGPEDLPEGATFIGKPFSAETVHEHLCKVLPHERLPAPLRDRQ